MMELMLNCENPELLKQYMDLYPIDGITVNPKMVARLKQPDFFGVVKKLRELAGEKKLYVQVTSPVYEEMLEEADLIRKAGGEETYVKIPANETGIKVIKTLSGRGYRTTATVVYSAGQGILALKAGASYIAPFYGPMLQAGIDAETEVRRMACYVKKSGCQGKILTAACRTFEQFSTAIEAGSDALTVDPNFLTTEMNVKPSADILNDFIRCWEDTYGAGKKIIDMKGELAL